MHLDFIKPKPSHNLSQLIVIDASVLLLFNQFQNFYQRITGVKNYLKTAQNFQIQKHQTKVGPC